MLHFTVIVKSIINLQNDASGHNLKCEVKTIKRRTSAREIAHTMGFAKENECNFLGWLACATGGIPDYEYSGHFSAYIYCSNALYKADKELWRSASANLSQKVKKDLASFLQNNRQCNS